MNITGFIATGDAFITRRLPEKGYWGFESLRSILNSYDVRFSNLEMTVHRGEGYPAAFSGGTWAMAEPKVLDDLMRYGFNLFNTANNHSLDYSIGGLLATVDQLQQRNALFAGTGRNLQEASAPVYLETPNSRVALLAASASFHDSDIAGNQGISMKGRPGLNPLRFNKVYYVQDESYAKLEQIAHETKMNVALQRSIQNGYRQASPEGQLDFGGLCFKRNTETYMDTEPNQGDIDRMVKGIKEAKRQADYVLVSLHAHTAKAEDTSIPARYIETFARACIDAGADAVLGHGPHELRGIEIYRQKPIFYSLGNFIFQTETVELQPAEAYEKNKLPHDAATADLMDKRSANGTRGFPVDPNIWRTVMAGFTAEDGVIREIQLYPVSLGMDLPRSRRGNPVLVQDTETIRYLQELSAPYGTNIDIQNGIGIIRL